MNCMTEAAISSIGVVDSALKMSFGAGTKAHAEAELIHIGLHMLNRYMVVDSVDTPLDDSPKGFNTVGVLSVSFGKLYLMVHHDTNEILRILNPAFVNDIVTTILVRHNSSTFLNL